MQIYNDQCGLEIVSRHSDLGVAKWEGGMSADADCFVFPGMQLRELSHDPTPPTLTLRSRGNDWSHDLSLQLTH